MIEQPTIGDWVRELSLPATSGEISDHTKLAGRPTVLFFYPDENAPAALATLLAFRDANKEFDARHARILGVSPTSSETQKAFVAEHQIPFWLLSDTAGNVAKAWSLPTQPGHRRTILIGPDLRIRKIYDDPDPAMHAAEVLADVDQLIYPQPPRRVTGHAPVLLVPNVFSPEICARLIEIWHEQGNEDSGFMKQVEGKTVGVYNYAHKIRRDHFLKAGPDLEIIKNPISARIIPSMKQAFNYQVTRFEDFRIACYDASRGGYFRPHRDNTTDGTAHRRFAMSLLLNDDYEGGTLRFPEYGLDEYRPGAGSAVIFSCSLLHEATDVTAGRRFVLLTFFYGEQEARMREEYNRRVGGEYRAVH